LTGDEDGNSFTKLALDSRQRAAALADRAEQDPGQKHREIADTGIQEDIGDPLGMARVADRPLAGQPGGGSPALSSDPRRCVGDGVGKCSRPHGVAGRHGRGVPGQSSEFVIERRLCHSIGGGGAVRAPSVSWAGSHGRGVRPATYHPQSSVRCVSRASLAVTVSCLDSGGKWLVAVAESMAVLQAVGIQTTL